MDRGDCYDRRCNLDLQATGVELAKPSQLRRGIRLIETADKILVAGDHHHDDQRCYERSVNQPQHREDHIRLLELKDLAHDACELENERKSVNAQRGRQTEIEYGQEPTATEN